MGCAAAHLFFAKQSRNFLGFLGSALGIVTPTEIPGVYIPERQRQNAHLNVKCVVLAFGCKAVATPSRNARVAHLARTTPLAIPRAPNAMPWRGHDKRPAEPRHPRRRLPGGGRALRAADAVPRRRPRAGRAYGHPVSLFHGMRTGMEQKDPPFDEGNILPMVRFWVGTSPPVLLSPRLDECPAFFLIGICIQNECCLNATVLVVCLHLQYSRLFFVFIFSFASGMHGLGSFP